MSTSRTTCISLLGYPIEMLYSAIYNYSGTIQYLPENFNIQDFVKNPQKYERIFSKLRSILGEMPSHIRTLAHLKKNYKDCWTKDILASAISDAESFAFGRASRNSLIIAKTTLESVGRNLKTEKHLFVAMAANGALMPIDDSTIPVAILHDLTTTAMSCPRDDFLYMFYKYYCYPTSKIAKAREVLKRYKESINLSDSMSEDELIVWESISYLID